MYPGFYREKIETAVDIYIPIQSPIDFEDYFEVEKDSAIKELAKLSGKINVTYFGNVMSTLEVEVLAKDCKEVREVFDAPTIEDTGNLPHCVVKFSSSYQVSKLIADSEPKEYYSYSYIFSQYIRHLLIYSQIAKPGGFNCLSGFIISNDRHGVEKLKFSGLYSSLSEVNFSYYKWPTLHNLPLKEVLSWLEKHWISFESKSKNRLDLALNAFSYLFHETHNFESAEDLFFAMVGIEAIYVKGNSSILHQLDTKSQIVLGERKENKKTFKKLYDFRSRFIHGQLGLINKFHTEDDINSDTVTSLLNTFSQSQFAVLILLTTIQEHFVRGVDEFEFITSTKLNKET